MPIAQFVDVSEFDPETKRVMDAAFEMAREALQLGDERKLAIERIAKSIIALAKAGEHNADLFEHAHQVDHLPDHAPDFWRIRQYPCPPNAVESEANQRLPLGMMSPDRAAGLNGPLMGALTPAMKKDLDVTLGWGSFMQWRDDTTLPSPRSFRPLYAASLEDRAEVWRTKRPHLRVEAGYDHIRLRLGPEYLRYKPRPMSA
jgi:hypothetical protein